MLISFIQKYRKIIFKINISAIFSGIEEPHLVMAEHHVSNTEKRPKEDNIEGETHSNYFMYSKGPFTLSVSVNAATTLQQC